MKLLPEEEIQRIVRSGFIPSYYNSLYRQERYAFGFELTDEDHTSAPAAPGAFPVWPESKVEYERVGRSRRIMANIFTQIAQLRFREVVPEFPGVQDDILKEMRQAYYIGRAKGLDGTGGFVTEIDQAVVDGIAFGTGFVRHGTRDTDKGTVASLTHYSPLNVLYDGHATNINRARWICFVTMYPVEEAVALFGEEVEKFQRTRMEDDTHLLQFVRIFEYFDLGIGKNEPTEAVMVDDFDGPVIRRRKNELGFLPFSAYTHFYLARMNRPIGRILQQQAVEKAISEIEEMIDASNRQKPMVAVDEERFDKKDLQRWANGEDMDFVRYRQGKDMGSAPPFHAITPSAQVSPAVFQRLQMLFTELAQQSGVSNFSKGIADKDANTATEATLIANQSSVQGNWDVRQIGLFFEDVVRKFIEIGRRFDNAPLKVDIYGVDFTINDPNDPDTSLEAILEDESPVLVTLETLYVQDQERKRYRKLAELRGMLADGFNPIRVLEEMLKTFGYQDRDEWLPMDQATAMPGQGGAPMPQPEQVLQGTSPAMMG